MDRRDFLRAAGSAAAVAGFGWGCGSGSGQSKTTATPKQPGASGAAPKELRIAQWSHFVPAYDTWFDEEYARRWGEAHDVEVRVEHLPLNELPIRGESEAASKRGHDLFWFINPRAILEDEVIDHREIVEEVSAKVGKMTAHVERGVFNPKTTGSLPSLTTGPPPPCIIGLTSGTRCSRGYVPRPGTTSAGPAQYSRPGAIPLGWASQQISTPVGRSTA
jgi:hypothetical protein